MKLAPSILLGLGFSSAVMASRDINNLRHANTSSSRQLRNRNSNTVSGGTWMWYFMLNCVHVGDLMGGGCNSQACSASSSSSSSYSSSAYSSSTIYNGE